MKEKAENILCAEGCPETLPTVFFKIMCMKMFYKISTNKSKYENATCSYRRTGGLPLYFHVLRYLVFQPYDECFGAFADILNETENFLEKYENFFTEENFARYLEKRK